MSMYNQNASQNMYSMMLPNLASLPDLDQMESLQESKPVDMKSVEEFRD